MNNRTITKEMARKELARRELERRNSQTQQPRQQTQEMPSYQDYQNLVQRMGPIGISPEEMRRRSGEFGLGAAQSAANYPIELINLFKQQPINKFNFAPDTGYSKGGQVAGDIGSFFMPGGSANLGIKALSSIPKLGRGINAIKTGIQERPLINSLLQILKGGGETGLYAATKAKEGEVLPEASKGAGLGMGINALTQLIGSKYPILSRLGLAGLGYAAGQPFGHPYTGAGLALAAPQLKGALLGLSKEELAKSALSGLTEKDVSRSLAANERLGTVPTPGQASGSITTRAEEGKLMRGAGHLGEQLEKEQIGQQQTQVNKLLDSIYKPTVQNQNKITKLYEEANKVNIGKNSLKTIKQNKVWNKALNEAKRDASFQEKMNMIAKQRGAKSIPENNYAYLDEAKTKIDDMYQKAINSGDLRQAKRIDEQRKSYLNKLDQLNPKYKEARAAAQPQIVRRNLEDKMNVLEENITAKNLYTKLLGNRKTNAQVLRDLKNFPEARKALSDIRIGWKQYSKPKESGQAHAQAFTNIDQARNIMDKVNDFLRTTSLNKATAQRAKYIHSKEWPEGFRLLKNAKNFSEQNKILLNMISRTGQAYGLDNNEISNLIDLVTKE